MPSKGLSLIVGGGLAGNLMAWELHSRGHAFEMWSDGTPAASSVAAGMFNPVSFRRILPQWNARLFQAEARNVFQRIEKELDCSLWHDVPILRVFPDQAYAKLWSERAEPGAHEVSEFIECVAACDVPKGIKAPHGMGRVPEAGWVDVEAFVQKSIDAWNQMGLWRDQSWSLQDGCPIGFENVIDCRGVGATEDLAQFGLELRKNHGEVIRVAPDCDWGNETVNNVTWALPLSDGSYRVGSTYRWDVHEPMCLSETPSMLIKGVSQVRERAGNVELLEHKAGLRPSCFDRRPILGIVSDRYPFYHVCNGWGTRGVSIGPAMVRWVADMIWEGKTTPESVAPERFRTFTKN